MNRVALITGSSGTLGGLLAKSLIERGYSLILLSRNSKDIIKLKINHKIQFLYYYSLDALNEKLYSKLTKFLKKNNINKIDLLINNLGAQQPIGNFFDTNIDDWINNINVNFLSHVRLIHTLKDFLLAGKNSLILNISGGGATSPRLNFSAYSCAKTALVRFSENLALELLDYKIRINAIAPGQINSKMMDEIICSGKSNAGEKEILEAHKIKQNNLDNLTKVIDLIFFLDSERGQSINGKLISAQWDNWSVWSTNENFLMSNDLYTLRRIVGRDRNFIDGDIS